MGCEDVKRVIYFFLDGQLGDRKQRDVKQHLNLCPGCEQRTTLQRRLREFIRRRLRPMSASEKFKQRLSRSLRAFRAEWSS
jgi:mycothiol system anti-sigma-R factor